MIILSDEHYYLDFKPEPSLTPTIISKAVIKMLQHSLQMRFSVILDHNGNPFQTERKMGDTVKIRKPVQFGVKHD